MEFGTTAGDLNELSITSSNRTANKFMNIQNNQTASMLQQPVALKPNALKMTPSFMGFSAPVRAGPAPRMVLDAVESVLEAKLPVVDF